MAAPPNNNNNNKRTHHHHNHYLAPSSQPPLVAPPATTNRDPPPLAPAALSSLSLESYISLFQALTKGAPTVQGVSAIEEAGMRLPDLRALAAANGVAVVGVGGSGAPARRDVLLSLRGRELADPLACVVAGKAEGGGAAAAAVPHQQHHHHRNNNNNNNSAPLPFPTLPITAADFGALGWVGGPGELGQMERALRSMSIVSLPPPLPPPPGRQEDGGMQQGEAVMEAAATATGPATAAPATAAPIAAAQMQPDDDDDETMLSEGAAAVAAAAADADADATDAADAADAADAPTSKATPPSEPAPVPWLPAAMERFARAVAATPFVAAASMMGATQAGGVGFGGSGFPFGFSSNGSSNAVGANADTANATAPAPATQQQQLTPPTEPAVAPGDIVGVCLLEPMDVTAAAPTAENKNSNTAAAAAGRRAVLAPGVYCARLVRRLGPACIPVSVCEPLGCPAVHDFYHCRLLPSPLVVQGGGEGEEAEAAAAAASAAAAALSGRAVTLVLDLHAAQRCARGLAEMARLDPERLQDAWVALSQAGGGGAAAASQAVAVAAGGGGGGAQRPAAAAW